MTPEMNRLNNQIKIWSREVKLLDDKVYSLKQQLYKLEEKIQAARREYKALGREAFEPILVKGKSTKKIEAEIVKALNLNQEQLEALRVDMPEIFAATN